MQIEAHDRIVIELDPLASPRRQREVGAFVRYCVFRIEREFGELHWLVKLKPSRGGYSCSVTVTIANLIIEARGQGLDAVFSAWDALSNTEQGLREAQVHRQVEQAGHLSGLKASANDG